MYAKPSLVDAPTPLASITNLKGIKSGGTWISHSSIIRWTSSRSTTMTIPRSFSAVSVQATGEYFGVAKCKILPPTGMYHHVLPLRIRDRLVFTLCYACAQDSEKPAMCVHEDNKRAVIGTRCTPELYELRMKGTWSQRYTKSTILHDPKPVCWKNLWTCF